MEENTQVIYKNFNGLAPSFFKRRFFILLLEKRNRKMLKMAVMLFAFIFLISNFNPIKAEAAGTVIDVTGLASGAETSHDCSKYMETKHNDLQHWQECSICGKVYGTASNHSFSDGGWTLCSPDYCNEYNLHTFVYLQNT